MRFNKKLGALLGIVIFLIWGINLYFYTTRKLNRPIFGYSYMNGETGSLNYIIDKLDEDRIQLISFPELDDMEIRVGEQSQFSNSNEDIYDGNGMYKLCKIDFYNSSGVLLSGAMNIFDKVDKDVTITKVKYKTKSGEVGEYNIGKIVLKKDENLEDNQHVNEIKESILQFRSSTYSTEENIAKSGYVSLKDIELKEIKGEFKDELFKYYDLYFNENKITEKDLPLKIGKDTNFSIGLKAKIKVPFYISFNTKNYFVFSDDSGLQNNIPIPYNEESSNVNYEDVKELLKLRGVR